MSGGVAELFSLEGRRGFVSGVTSGIGAAAALALAQAGCDVAGCGRSPADHPGAQAFLRGVEAFGRRAHYVQVDIARRDAASAAVESTVAALGGLDLLVSNAGKNVFVGAAETTEADWEECMNLDLAAHWRLAVAAKPHLERGSHGAGVIIVIGSNHGWYTMPGCFPYNVAKAGLLGLVQSLAVEWGPRIRTVGVAPGFIDTPGNQTWFDSFPDPRAERARTEALHPVGRLGTPGELGALCVFLAGPSAGFISGTTLCVDGGRSALM